MIAYQQTFLAQKYGYGGWVHMNHATSSCSGPREADMMKDGKFFRKVKVKKVFIVLFDKFFDKMTLLLSNNCIQGFSNPWTIKNPG
jgi:hypothetical protein